MTPRRKGPSPAPLRQAEVPKSDEQPASRDARTKTPLVRVADVASHVLVPVGFFVLMWVLHPFRTFFEFDPDEGNNVIKALLLSRGYHLYSQIWSDQAPLFTYALRGWFAVFGPEVNAARTLVLALSSVTLWAVYRTVRITWSHLHGLAAALLLVLSPFYTVLSVSVMLGLPSLAMAALSLLALTRWHQRGGAVWLVLSAVAMSLSVMTKLFTAFLVPIFVVAIVLAEWQRQRGTPRRVRRLWPAALWCVVFVAVTAVILLATISPSDMKQLIEPHLAARTETRYAKAGESYGISYWLFGPHRGGAAQDVAALAGVGLLFVLLRHRWFSLIGVAWSLTAYAALSKHAPVWYHHMPLVFLPLSLLGGIAAGEILAPRRKVGAQDAMRLRLGAGLLRIAAVVCVVFVGIHVRDKIDRSSKFGSMVLSASRDRYLTALMKQYAPRSRWVFSDRQMFAFRAGLLVPPELSVTSQKRMRTGNLTEQQLLECLKRYDVDQVVFCGWRIEMTRDMARFLSERYVRIFEDEGLARMFIKRELDPEPVKTLEAALAESPDCPQAYDVLALWHARQNDYDGAIELYRRALKADPSHARSTVYLADTLMALGRFEEGFAAYRQGMDAKTRHDRPDPYTAASYAWRLATCTESARRNGQLAEELAIYAIRARGGEPGDLNVLAAAYAEQGRFTDAVRIAQAAIHKAREDKKEALARQIQSRLELYQANHPYRESPTIPVFRS